MRDLLVFLFLLYSQESNQGKRRTGDYSRDVNQQGAVRYSKLRPIATFSLYTVAYTVVSRATTSSILCSNAQQLLMILTSTLIFPDIVKTESNNYFIINLCTVSKKKKKKSG